MGNYVVKDKLKAQLPVTIQANHAPKQDHLSIHPLRSCVRKESRMIECNLTGQHCVDIQRHNEVLVQNLLVGHALFAQNSNERFELQ